MKQTEQELEDRLKGLGYKFLGWQSGWQSVLVTKGDGAQYFTYTDPEEYANCIKQEHNDWRKPKHYESIQHTTSGSRNTVYCDYCKIYWKYDCS